MRALKTTPTSRPRPNRHERRRRKALGRRILAKLMKAAKRGDADAQAALSEIHGQVHPAQPIEDKAVAGYHEAGESP